MNKQIQTENQANEHRTKQQLDRIQELDDIKEILNLPSGIRFFRRFFEKGSMFRTTFTGNSNGFFLEGQRNIALMFFSDICEAAPERVAELMIKKVEEGDGESNYGNDAAK